MARPSKFGKSLSGSARFSALYAEAMSLPADERGAFIERETSQDPELREVFFLHLSQMAGSESIEGLLVPPAPNRRRNWATDPPFALGEQRGDFKIIRILGTGGFGVVYLARQVSLNREVALKVSENIGQEAKILASLDHDNIVKVYSESIEPELNLRMICMQFIPGATLSDTFRNCANKRNGIRGADIVSFLNRSSDTLPEPEKAPLMELDFQESVLWIGARLADALSYAHQKGILHLDLKPSNVLMSQNGRPLLTDFGISVTYLTPEPSQNLVLGGTPQWMAPEHEKLFKAKDIVKAMKSVDHRADLYSLGLLVRELLWQELAPSFRDESASRQLTALLKAPTVQTPTSISPEVWNSVDVGIRLIIHKCLAANPDRRFQSAAALAQAFDGCREIRDILKSYPRSGWGLILAMRFPWLAMTLCWFLPQVAASFVCAVYLSGSIDSIALWGGFYPFAFIYFALSIAWMFWLTPLMDYCFHPVKAFENAEAGPQTRNRALRVSRFSFLVFCFLWLPGHVLSFGWQSEGILNMNPAELLHPIFVCGFSALIALSVSVLLTQLVALHAVYPCLWLGSSSIRDTAGGELYSLKRRLRKYYFLLIVAPAVAAVLAMLDPGRPAFDLNLLLSSFAGILLAGILIDYTVSHHITECVFAFSASKRSRAEHGKGGSLGTAGLFFVGLGTFLIYQILIRMPEGTFFSRLQTAEQALPAKTESRPNYRADLIEPSPSMHFQTNETLSPAIPFRWEVSLSTGLPVTEPLSAGQMFETSSEPAFPSDKTWTQVIPDSESREVRKAFPVGHYFWRIRVGDKPSEIREFWVDRSNPEPVKRVTARPVEKIPHTISLLVPREGWEFFRGQASTPADFSWRDSKPKQEGKNSYAIDLSKDANFKSRTTLQSTESSLSGKFLLSLSPGHYYWRVRTISTSGGSDVSSRPSSFEVRAASIISAPNSRVRVLPRK